MAESSSPSPATGKRSIAETIRHTLSQVLPASDWRATNSKASKRRKLAPEADEGARERQGSDDACSAELQTHASRACGPGGAPDGLAEDFDVEHYVAWLLDPEHKGITARRKDLTTKIDSLNESHGEASEALKSALNAVHEKQFEVNRTEAELTAAREKLDEICVAVKDNRKARDDKGKLCINQAKTLGLPTDQLLSKARASPDEHQLGDLGKYVKLHRELLDSEAQHKDQELAVEHAEAAAKSSATELEQLKEKLCTAELAVAEIDFDNQMQVLKEALAKVDLEEADLQRKRQHLLNGADAGFGPGGVLPLAAVLRQPNNLTAFVMLQSLTQKMEVMQAAQTAQLTQLAAQTAEQIAQINHDIAQLTAQQAAQTAQLSQQAAQTAELVTQSQQDIQAQLRAQTAQQEQLHSQTAQLTTRQAAQTAELVTQSQQDIQEQLRAQTVQMGQTMKQQLDRKVLVAF